MRLSDVLELTIENGLRRFCEKRAGIMLPLAIGATIPGIAHKAIERANSTEKTLEAATDHTFRTAALPPWLARMGQSFSSNVGGPMGRGASSVGKGLWEGAQGSAASIGGAPAAGIAHGLSDMVQKKLFGQQLGERKDMMGMAGSEAIKTFGKEMGTTGADLLRDMAAKAMASVGQAGDTSAREAILGELKRTDPVLAGADDAVLMDSYHTMTRFAPVLSTDKNAVRSFLRQAVMSGAGPDFMSIKHLADSERAVTGEKRASFGHSKRHSVDDVALGAIRGGLTGAGLGAVTGAAVGPEDRANAALKGGLAGGGLGALAGAAHELSKPKSFWYGMNEPSYVRLI